jgi:hypothetical protein
MHHIRYNPLDERSARRKDLGFEPTIPGSERPQTNTLDLAVTGIGKRQLIRLGVMHVIHFTKINSTVVRYVSCSAEGSDKVATSFTGCMVGITLFSAEPVLRHP